MRSIDLNCDLGEGLDGSSLEIDTVMLGIVSSANVACGGHAGDLVTMRATVAAAADRGVAIGAHVSYDDLEHFGRRPLDPPSAELVATLVAQLETLRAVAERAGTAVRYVKPHGALYNTIARDERQALDVVEAIRAVDADLPLLGLAGSRGLGLAASAGLTTVAEAFADRAYAPTGMLVSRSEAGAVLHDAELVAERMRGLVRAGGVPAVDGTTVRLDAASICVHSDTEGAIVMAARIREALEGDGVTIRPFAGEPVVGEARARGSLT